VGQNGRPVGAVVIGTRFGCFTHVRALRAAGFDIKAIVGRDPDKTAILARQFDVPLALTSLPAALELSGVEAVTVATPPRTHCQLVLDALAAGKHVICEGRWRG
jgi:predicted dehydrogenase